MKGQGCWNTRFVSKVSGIDGLLSMVTGDLVSGSHQWNTGSGCRNMVRPGAGI
jgi:hypothetical protein